MDVSVRAIRTRQCCRKFNLLIAGLDNIAARRWMNATLHDMVDRTSGEPDPSTLIIPIIRESQVASRRWFVVWLFVCRHFTVEAIQQQCRFVRTGN